MNGTEAPQLMARIRRLTGPDNLLSSGLISWEPSHARPSHTLYDFTKYICQQNNTDLLRDVKLALVVIVALFHQLGVDQIGVQLGTVTHRLKAVNNNNCPF